MKRTRLTAPRWMVLVWWLAAGPAWSESGASLDLPLDPRSVALGPGAAALADGAGGVYVNPAGLGVIERSELFGTHSSYIQNTQLSAASAALRLTPLIGLGLGYVSLGSGGFDGRDADGNRMGTFSAEDRTVSLTLARRLTMGGAATAVGATVKYFESRIADARARAVAFDLGIRHRLADSPLGLALVGQNLGPALRYNGGSEPLPIRATLGISYALPAGTFVLGVSDAVVDKRVTVGVGAETKILGALSLRGRYETSIARDGLPPERLAGFAGGIGLNLASQRIDASVQPMGESGTTMRFAVTIRFGQSALSSLVPADDKSRRIRGGSAINTLIRRKAGWSRAEAEYLPIAPEFAEIK